MINYIEDYCEGIDASMFSGDAFHYRENLDPLKYYIERWSREIENIEKKLVEQEKEKCACPHEKVKENENALSGEEKYICTVCGNTYPF